MTATKEQPDSRVGRIYVCQPSYAVCVPQSSKQFWTASSTKYNGRCYKVQQGGSLLANCFNQFWVHALNLQESYQAGAEARLAGMSLKDSPHPKDVDTNLIGAAWEEGWKGTGNFTHFAMLHDDIVPQNNWLDALVDELLATGADLLSAVVPIKDVNGMTSTAIDGEDIFLVERRITMTEVYRLPPTFSAADCGYPSKALLTNSGCWVCDFTKPWRYNIRFTIQDRIRRDPRTGLWQAEVASEDWQFARDVQAQGGKVLATRKVGLAHFGHLPFANNGPWGEAEYDTASAHRFGGVSIGERPAQNKAAKPVGWHPTQDLPDYATTDYADVPGWLNQDEGTKLRELAAGARVAEVGSYCGRSTIWMGAVAREMHCVDTWDSRGTPAAGYDLREAFERNIHRYNVHARVHAHQGTSPQALLDLPGYFDLVFIDGAHDLASVRMDIDAALSVLYPTGTLVLHDYCQDREPGVVQAVRERFDLEGITSGPGSLLVIPEAASRVRG
jgi:hypothetical protein